MISLGVMFLFSIHSSEFRPIMWPSDSSMTSLFLKSETDLLSHRSSFHSLSLSAWKKGIDTSRSFYRRFKTRVIVSLIVSSYSREGVANRLHASYWGPWQEHSSFHFKKRFLQSDSEHRFFLSSSYVDTSRGFRKDVNQLTNRFKWRFSVRQREAHQVVDQSRMINRSIIQSHHCLISESTFNIQRPSQFLIFTSKRWKWLQWPTISDPERSIFIDHGLAFLGISLSFSSVFCPFVEIKHQWKLWFVILLYKWTCRNLRLFFIHQTSHPTHLVLSSLFCFLMRVSNKHMLFTVSR